jgi:peptidoglycan/LPS O-acetylase OafA/YrhL
MGSAGMVGVTLFFVLSGFLITRILREKRPTLKAFYGRRARRLLPALILYSIVLAVVVGWSQAWPALFYVGNYAQIAGHAMPLNAHTWSLAVEEHFYLIWPLALTRIRTVRPVIVLIGASLLLRLLVPDQWAYEGSFTSFFALGIGGALAWLWDVKPARWVGPVALTGILALGLYPIAEYTEAAALQAGRWIPVVTSLFAAAAVWVAAHAWRYLEFRPLAFAGALSYGWYLWHVPIVFVLIGTPWLLPGLVGSLLVAWLSYRFVEQPILNNRTITFRQQPIELSR